MIMMKKIKSNILNQDRDWIDVNDKLPDINQRVVFRITNPDLVINETDEEILLVEDIKVGRFLPGIDGNGGKWCIDPPYTLYDYSPLSNKESLKKGANVTHWAVPTPEELEGWDNRLSPVGTYKHLSINVDKEHEEILYKALLWGSMLIGNIAKDKDCEGEELEKIEKMTDILYDLQYCMDTGKAIENYDPTNEPSDSE